MRMPWEISREMFLSFEETERLLACVRSRTHQGPGREAVAAMLDRVIIETLLLSGVRNSELCRLAIADASIAGSESHLLIRGQRKQDRTVFIPQHLAELLSTFITHVRPQLLPDDVSARDPKQPLLFGEHRQPYERTGLYRRVVRILTEAGLAERASVQLLRHTYGYLAYAQTGGNLLFVQRQLGHAHPIITSIYAQFVDESYAAMADMVADPSRPAGRAVIRPAQRKGPITWKRRNRSRRLSDR